MHDLRSIRENPDAFDAALKKRGMEPMAAEITAADQQRRNHIQKLQDAQKERNDRSKEIGAAKARGDDAAAQEAIKAVADLKAFIQSGEETERMLTATVNDMVAGLPNVPLDDVPEGADEDDNVEVRRHGDPPEMAFEARQHFEIGEVLGLMDFETAAGMSGSRFVLLSGPLARLERAIAQFMLDLQTGEHGYQEVSPPVLVRDEALFGTGQLPKFADDLFKTEEGHWLIPTAEVSLTNIVREKTLDAAQLPLRFTASTPCFRAEAGAAGRDTRGMIRQHQFTKVELVSITQQEMSTDELERMTGCAEAVLKQLGLPYRVMLLSTGDMGFSARKTYDLEVWLPGQNAYREISSCSVCGDFQARRMNARYKAADGKTHFVHTLNGSGLAVGRTLIAVVENYQREDGSITVPDALQPYMGGLTEITPPST